MAEFNINPKMYMYKRVVEAKLYIDNHYHERIDLNNISNQAHFSKYHFLRLFKKSFGKSPHQYLIETRLLAAKRLLQANRSVTEVCYDVGFESIPSFITLFKKREGFTPLQYLKKMRQREQAIQARPRSFIPNCFGENMDLSK